MVKVLVDVRPLETPYDYVVPEGLDVEVGSAVRVDFAGRSVRGWVVADAQRPAVDAGLKEVKRLLAPVPVADAATICLAEWASAEYAGSPAALLAWATPQPLPRTRRRAPSPRPLTRARVPGVTDAIADGRAVEAAIRTWPGDDGASTVAALAASVPPGRTLLVVSPPSWQPELQGGVDLGRMGTTGWEMAAGGAARIVVGGRHSVLVPLPRLGAVCVTAEHSDAHKDQQAPCLDARVLARRRAADAGVPFVAIGPTSPVGVEGLTASAAAGASDRPPPLELVVPGMQRRWPRVEVVDLRDDPPGGALSGRFFSAVRATHAAGGATLVYLNRKGTARSMVCRHCGEAAACSRCGASMRPDAAGLGCPRCGLRLDPGTCPACGSPQLRRVGLGIDRLTTELRAALPDVEIVESSAASVPEPLPHGIVVGTRAAFRHRNAFDLVVLVDPDADLARPGLRAEESAFAALVDAVGTARNRADGGHVLVQTRRPEAPAIQALATHDTRRFEMDLLARRRVERLPPFRRILEVSSTSAAAVDDVARVLSRHGVDVIGPRPDPRPSLLAIVGSDAWRGVTAAVREVALSHRPARVRVEADPLDPG